jgi:raffinose/stachyose/melibiose transport system permease protein
MHKQSYVFYLMAIPALLLFFGFHTFPALTGLFYSFTNWDGFSETYDFVGLKNYLNVFKDDLVLSAYGFTFKFAILSTLLVNAISLLIALGLNANIRFRNFFRGVYFLPNVLSVLVVGFIFNFMFANLIPDVFTRLGLESWSYNILGSMDYAWIGIVIVTVWQSVAFNTILYLAGLQTIPKDLYESSSLDGAGKWTEFWKITFPLLASFFTINMVLALKNFLMVFDQVIALTGGGPGTVTESIAVQIYRGGFLNGEFAYQSANAVIYFIVIAIISFVQLRYLQKREIQL